MPVNRSADGLRRSSRVRAVLHAAPFTPGQKLLLLVLNAWPFAHLVGAAALLALTPWPWTTRAGATLVWLLAVPPLLCRLIVNRGLPPGPCAVPSRTFFRWWATWQLQMLFNRFPFLDEALRFVPGFYSMWLRLWGAKIGRLTLWSPGVRVFDRALLHLGHDVVLGIDARLVGHFGGLDEAGAPILTLGHVMIGDRATIGGSALLGPGVMIESDQATEVLFLGAPFTLWRAGEQISHRNPHPSAPAPHP